MEETGIYEKDLWDYIQVAFLNILSFQAVSGAIGDGQELNKGHVWALSDILGVGNHKNVKGVLFLQLL